MDGDIVYVHCLQVMAGMGLQLASSAVQSRLEKVTLVELPGESQAFAQRIRRLRRSPLVMAYSGADTASLRPHPDLRAVAARGLDRLEDHWLVEPELDPLMERLRMPFEVLLCRAVLPEGDSEGAKVRDCLATLPICILQFRRCSRSRDARLDRDGESRDRDRSPL